MLKKLEMSGMIQLKRPIYLEYNILTTNTASPDMTEKKMHSWYSPTLELSNSIKQMKVYVIIVQVMSIWIEL